jgi:hypothetical protein
VKIPNTQDLQQASSNQEYDRHTETKRRPTKPESKAKEVALRQKLQA